MNAANPDNSRIEFVADAGCWFLDAGLKKNALSQISGHIAIAVFISPFKEMTGSEPRLAGSYKADKSSLR